MKGSLGKRYIICLEDFMKIMLHFKLQKQSPGEDLNWGLTKYLAPLMIIIIERKMECTMYYIHVNYMDSTFYLCLLFVKSTALLAYCTCYSKFVVWIETKSLSQYTQIF